MNDLLGSIREIVARDRLAAQGPLILRETHPGSKCGPIQIDAAGDHLAIRLGDRDYLPLLSQAAQVRKLPDYLIFADPPPGSRRKRRDLLLQVVVCELKSGSAGVEAAYPQLRCGKLLARYLVGLAAMRICPAEPAENLEISYTGLIAVPQRLYRNRLTQEKLGANVDHDGFSAMPVHRIGDGGAIELELLMQ